MALVSPPSAPVDVTMTNPKDPIKWFAERWIVISAVITFVAWATLLTVKVEANTVFINNLNWGDLVNRMDLMNIKIDALAEAGGFELEYKYVVKEKTHGAK